MKEKIQLGDRMKRYESVSKTILTPKVPVIIRLDGKAFHTFTKKFVRPFDDLLIATMQETMLYLCKNIQGCVLGYTQSDEITLVLIDYQNINSSPWFDYEVQKLCSISASMATLQFNKIFAENLLIYRSKINCKELEDQCSYYTEALKKGAMFDSRCFNVPKQEVTNCLIWRQQDATRNSIQMVGQSYFSHKTLLGKSCNEIQDMLHETNNINWNNFETWKKRGTCCKRELGKITIDLNHVPEKHWPEGTTKEGILEKEELIWKIDFETPIFTKDRNYIESLININYAK